MAQDIQQLSVARSAPRVPEDLQLDRTLVQAVLSRYDAGTQAVAMAVVMGGMDRAEAARQLGVSLRTVTRKLEGLRATSMCA